MNGSHKDRATTDNASGNHPTADDTAKLSPEEAKALLDCIADVEREEAEHDANSR
ncbi:MAG: hypothetical protein R3E01_00885 [Pirellulaceae bacterium]|nr:hypothetical protein [Planctomycetales bacterium]